MSLNLCCAVVNARRYPERMALSWSGRSIAWDAFNNYLNSTSRYLKEISIRSGVRVLLVKEDSPAYVIVLLALWRIGAVPCPVDPGMIPVRSALVYAAVKPDLVISARGFKKVWGQKARWADIEHVVAYGYNDSFLGSEAALDPCIDSSQPAILRLRISGEIVGVDVVTHEQLKEDPQDLGPLLQSLRTGETYVILRVSPSG